jgi:hypothetical protein
MRKKNEVDVEKRFLNLRKSFEQSKQKGQKSIHEKLEIGKHARFNPTENLKFISNISSRIHQIQNSSAKKSERSSLFIFPFKEQVKGEIRYYEIPNRLI